ncbi:MAG: MFS transporter [Clostridium sp.]|nr:MFS transporter [Clostridium sp.]
MQEKLRSVLKVGAPMVGYSTANILVGGSFYIIGLYFMMFLTEVEGLSFAQASSVVLVSRVWDAVIDPFMGLVTDRTRTRFGRRRPYYLLGIIPVIVTYLSLWNSYGISNERSTEKMLYFIFAYVAFTTACSLVAVPHDSLMPEIAPEYSLRVHYNSMTYIFNSVGMLSSFALTTAMFGFSETERFTPELKSKFMLMGLALGIFFAVPLVITFFSTKEKDWRNIPKPELNPREVFWEYRSALKNRAFRQFTLLNMVNYLCINIWSTGQPYFIKYVGRIDNKLNLVNTYDGAGQMAGFPLNYYLSLKLGKQAPARLLTPLMLIALAISFFITPKLGVENPQLVFYVQVAATMLFKFGYSGMGMMPSTIFPDTTDVDELITGQRREGVLSACKTFTTQAMIGLGQAMFGWICTAFGVAPASDDLYQTETAIVGLRVGYAIVPALLVALSIYLSRRYKMKKADLELIQRVVAEKKETGTVVVSPKEKQLLESISGQRFENMWIGRPAVQTEAEPV